MYSRISKHIHNKNVPERYIQIESQNRVRWWVRLYFFRPALPSTRHRLVLLRSQQFEDPRWFLGSGPGELIRDANGEDSVSKYTHRIKGCLSMESEKHAPVGTLYSIYGGDGRCAQINWPTSAVPESLSSASQVGRERREKRKRRERGRGGREGEEGREEGGRRDVDRREKERREGGRRRRVAASRIQRIGTSPH